MSSMSKSNVIEGSVTIRRGFAAACLAVLVFCCSTVAEALEHQFEATIDQIWEGCVPAYCTDPNDPCPQFPSEIAVGGTITGRYEFDPGVADSSSYPDRGFYRFNPLLGQFFLEAQISTYSWTTMLIDSDCCAGITVVDSSVEGELIRIGSVVEGTIANVDLWPNLTNLVALWLTNSGDLGALNGTALPTFPAPDLQDFEDTWIYIKGWWGPGSVCDYTIEGTLTRLEAVVPPPPEAIEELSSMTVAAEMPEGLTTALLKILDSALAALAPSALLATTAESTQFTSADSDHCAAANKLQAFINLVGTQSGKKIREDDAEMLIAYVREILEQMEC